MTRPADLDRAAVAAYVDRVLGRRVPVVIERTSEGTSTPVYRLGRGDEVLYLRAAEHPGHHLDVEVEVHDRLRQRGMQVPEVVHHEPADPRLGRGVAILRGLPGASLAAAPPDARVAGAVLREAGRDLARIEAFDVDGFGFLTRDGAAWPPRGPHPTAAAALLEATAEVPVAQLLGPHGTPARRACLQQLVADAELTFGGGRAACAGDGSSRAAGSSRASQGEEGPTAVLVHGDVDPAHIFHLDGRYTGMIDLGELRGATPGDDLARFRLWNGEGAPLDALTAGYAELASVPDDHERRCRTLAVLLGGQQLARWLVRDGPPGLERDVARRLQARLADLLDALA